MKMRRARIAVLTLGAAMFVAAAADAAPPGPRDPDWPCQQIKVPELSLASVWAGPSVDLQHIDWQHDQPIADLVHEIAQRREPLAQAQDKVHAFAQQAKAQKQQRLLALLAGLFTVLDQERGTVIAGLDRFGLRQKALAAGTPRG